MTEDDGDSAQLSLANLWPDAEERQNLSYLKLTDAADLTRETVGQTLLRVAAVHPDQPALLWLTEDGVAEMSWSELAARSTAAARELARINPTRGRIVVLGGNSTEWIVAVYGASLAAMPVVPLSPASTVDEISAVLGDFEVGEILFDDRAADQVLRDRSIEACSSAGSGAAVRPMSDWPPTDNVAFCEPSSAADEFLVQYTSGTTGRPKPASLSHVAALNAARFFAEGTGGDTGDVWLNPLPLYHVGGLVSGLLSCLSISGTYVVIERFSAEVALRAAREARPSFIGMCRRC